MMPRCGGTQFVFKCSLLLAVASKVGSFDIVRAGP